MPGLPKRQSLEGLDAYYEHQQTHITSAMFPTDTSTAANMAATVKYVPPQMDPLAGSSTLAARQSPLRLFLQDASVLITMLPYLPYIFLPLKANDNSSELYMNLVGARDMALQGWLFIMETCLLLLGPPALLLLPGLFSVVAIALCCLTIYVVTWPMAGPNVTFSRMDETTQTMAEHHKDERWIFINGTATG